MLVHFFYVMSGFEERNLNSKIHLEKSLKKIVWKIKRKKPFSPTSFFSAILAQTPRPLPGPRPNRLPLPLSPSPLTGGARCQHLLPQLPTPIPTLSLSLSSNCRAALRAHDLPPPAPRSLSWRAPRAPEPFSSPTLPSPPFLCLDWEVPSAAVVEFLFGRASSPVIPLPSSVLVPRNRLVSSYFSRLGSLSNCRRVSHFSMLHRSILAAVEPS